MTQTIQQREGLPDDMRILLRDYPREAWPDHPHFARSIQNWMGAHQMFRQLGEITAKGPKGFWMIRYPLMNMRGAWPITVIYWCGTCAGITVGKIVRFFPS